MEKVLKRQGSFSFMPTLDQINLTRLLNKLDPLSSLPKTRDETAPQQTAESSRSRELVTEEGKIVTSPSVILMEKYDMAKLGGFIDTVTVMTQSSQQVIFTSASELPDELAKLAETSVMPTSVVKDGLALPGINSALPKFTTNQNFNECVRRIFVENCMEAETLTIRHYDEVNGNAIFGNFEICHFLFFQKIIGRRREFGRRNVPGLS